ncbi:MULTISPECIES: M23 family metallopeptidase [Leptospira]|uniref:Peptidase, M23 family n=1 Tax=Leptospira kirschneri str. 200802841 TaxID=1193047 RepID=A0A828XWX5_9LEPT|nr:MULTISPECIES: M23 family metallopeptidase [Leptospira]EMO75559.1 peptidase, M23 family [Leptospira kirschneri str. 200801925]EJO69865.1 peptidase, M23 family [Leptospira kirschneri serovar Grippotyphosa str. RM52]EKO49873.1 peptidase, M23 family [Leptospira kirschneri str. 200802841]EMK05165.1 peptidase, M23 family [Leptospira kirschneri str. MMD1493]EMK06896.1 peptidase, M23 family [Leptospira kirschneri]
MKKFILIIIWTAFHLSIEAENNKVLNYLIPVKTDQLENKITSTFGESRGDHFHNGLDISSANEPVLAMADGKVLYSRYTEDHPFEDELGTGNSVWLDHGSGNFTAYYHLKDGRISKLLKPDGIKAGDKIGITGNSGHSSGAHLHFVVLRKHGLEILDPMKFLSPIPDSSAPEISSLLVHVNGKFTNINDGDNINLSKEFPFTISIVDAGEKKSQRRGITRVQYFLNGEALRSADFSALQYSASEWKNPDGFSFTNLYYKDQYLIGNLNLKSGENTIKVVAWDFRGNVNERSFTFYVSRI